MLASVATFAVEGVDGREVTVEVDMSNGLQVFTVVGLPDAAVREARERVRSALMNSGLDFPQKRLTANLAPADLRKAGPSFDLALALAVLGASDQVPAGSLEGFAVYGELSLSGALRPVRGALAIAAGAAAAGYRRLIVPVEDAPEAALVEGLEVLGVPTLVRLADLLHGRWQPEPATPRPVAAGAVGEGEGDDGDGGGGDGRPGSTGALPALDLADVRGQEDAKRALEIAAAGSHNLLMVGPPGAGKTMLARRLPGILPPPSFEEAFEITRVRSVAGLGDGQLATERPFRAPHHTISAPGLVGGGATPLPGELTLADHGVLFLDELAEFSRSALEALRQPLEDRRVAITRGQRTLVFPAAAMLVGACNPCPCGRAERSCICTDVDMLRYARRLSLPLLDRIDLVCRVDPPSPVELAEPGLGRGERSHGVRERVVAARERQARRLAGSGAPANGDMDGRLTRLHARLGPQARARLLEGHRLGSLTARGHDRVLRIARTIADLDGRERIAEEDIDEALGYRLPALRAAA